MLNRKFQLPHLGVREEAKLKREKDNLLQTGILAAVKKGDRDEVKALIGAKANIETKDAVQMPKFGFTIMPSKIADALISSVGCTVC